VGELSFLRDLRTGRLVEINSAAGFEEFFDEASKSLVQGPPR